MDQLQTAYLLRARAALDMAAKAVNTATPHAFVRTAIARALDPATPDAVAERRWGGEVTKAIGDSSADVARPGDAIFDAVAKLSAVGQLPLRPVPVGHRSLAMTARSSGYWVAEGKAIPISRAALSAASLAPRKVSTLIVVPLDILNDADPRVEQTLENDMAEAIAQALDAAFLDPAGAGDDKVPVSATHGVPSIVSVGDPAEDIAALIEAFPGDLRRAAFVSDPGTLAGLALARDIGGAYSFRDVGPTGGTILGLPALASHGSPTSGGSGQIALIDASGIAADIDRIEIGKSFSGSLEMTDTPLGDGTTPTASSVEVVNLFQLDAVGIRLTLHATWLAMRPSAALVTGCRYVETGSSSSSS